MARPAAQRRRSGTVDLPETLTDANAPVKLWETTEEIPSDHYGGHGSVAVAGGKVFLSLVWHRDEPTETRRIDGDVLSKLDYRAPARSRRRLSKRWRRTART